MRRSAGLTLVELLWAMGLLAALGALLMQLSRNAFEIYEQGDRRADLYQEGLAVLEQIEDDLTAVAGGRRGRFLLVRGRAGDGGEPGPGLLLKLVRTIPGGEMRHPHLRPAGTAPGASEVYTGKDPGIGSRASLAPPGGLLEVAYALIQEDEDPTGVLTLYRGVRAPALGEGSFFGGEAPQVPDPTWVRKHLRPVASGVLGLWLLCRSQRTTDWMEEEALDGRHVRDGSLTVWDSTRGILEPGRFPLAVAPASRDDTRDDVFPGRVRMVLQLARGWDSEARLVRPLAAKGEQLTVNDPRVLPEGGWPRPCVKLRGEWVRLDAVDGGEARVTRGVRGTAAAVGEHPPGTPVFVGRVFRKTVVLPVQRSVWTEGGEL